MHHWTRLFALLSFAISPLTTANEIPCRQAYEELIASRHAIPTDGTITPELWEKLTPYIMPDNHPIKASLDALFSQTRVIANLDSVKAAGFETLGPGHWSKTIVAYHKKMRKYVFKMYTDDQQGIASDARLVHRVLGAEVARQIIQKYGYQHLIKVPVKWIYVVPGWPAPAANSIPKHFIVVAEDMNLMFPANNVGEWRSAAVKPELLRALYTVISEGGFSDLIYSFNVPFSNDRKVAIIDTEIYASWPVPYDIFLKSLNPKLHKFWRALYQQ